MAIYVRGGLAFTPITERHLDPADDTTEVCGVRIISSKSSLNIYSVYRPPIRNTEGDDRHNHFDPGAFPSGEDVLILGDFNGYHPLWDHGCEVADSVGERVAMCWIKWTGPR